MSIWDTWASTLPGYSRLLADPTFNLITPQFKQQIHDVLFNYGIGGTDDQNALTGGMTIENNPYSVSAMLQKGRTENDHGTYNAANAAGLEESGAAAGALNANSEAYKAANEQARAKMGGEISGLLGKYTTDVGGIFQNLEDNPVAAATPDAAAPYTPAVGAPGTTEADRPGAGANPWHIPDANGQALGVAVPKPTSQTGNPWHIPGANGAGVTTKLKAIKVPVMGNHGVLT